MKISVCWKCHRYFDKDTKELDKDFLKVIAWPRINEGICKDCEEEEWGANGIETDH